MKPFIKLGLATVLVVCVLSGAFAEPIKLELKFTKGEVDKYKVMSSVSMSPSSASADIQPISITSTMLMTQRTVDVLPDGSGVVQVKTSSVQISGAPKVKGQKIPVASQAITMTISKEGKLLNIEGVGLLAGKLGSNMDFSKFFNQVGEQMIFPPDPVDVGQSWKNVLPFPFGGGSMSVVSTLTAVGEPVWTESAARIKQSYDGRIDLGQLMKAISSSISGKDAQVFAAISGSMDLNGATELLFSPARGKLLKADSNVTATMRFNVPAGAQTKGGGGNIEMTMQMSSTTTRVK